MKTEAEKKRKQRERAKRGSRVLLGLEIIDWDAWLEILRADGLLHGADTLGAVRLATERYVWEECRAYRREQAQEQLSQVGTPIIGLIDRETESRPDQLIKAKDLKRPSPNNINPATYQISSRRKPMALIKGIGMTKKMTGWTQWSPTPWLRKAATKWMKTKSVPPWTRTF